MNRNPFRSIIPAMLVIAVGMFMSGCSRPPAVPMAEVSAGERETTLPEKLLHATATVIMVEFDERHAAGSNYRPDDIETAIHDGGMPVVMALLGREGTAQLLMSGDSEGLTGSKLRFFIGDETPYVARIDMQERQPRTESRTMHVNTVTSGTTVDLDSAVRDERTTELKYRVDFDHGRPVEAGGLTSVARQRVQWQGDTVITGGHGVVIGRFTREQDGKPVQFVFILEVRDRTL